MIQSIDPEFPLLLFAETSDQQADDCACPDGMPLLQLSYNLPGTVHRSRQRAYPGLIDCVRHGPLSRWLRRRNHPGDSADH